MFIENGPSRPQTHLLEKAILVVTLAVGSQFDSALPLFDLNTIQFLNSSGEVVSQVGIHTNLGPFKAMIGDQSYGGRNIVSAVATLDGNFSPFSPSLHATCDTKVSGISCAISK